MGLDMKGFNDTIDHHGVEDKATQWIMDHEKNQNSLQIESIDFPNIRFESKRKVWEINGIIKWKQGLLGRIFKSFYNQPSAVYLEFDSEGNLVRHDLPRSVFTEEHPESEK
jgi:hypothetical protein